MKKFLINEFLYNGHLQSLGSVGIVLFAFYLFNLGGSFALALVLSTYCLFQPIYYYDRYKDYKKDFLTNRERSNHIKKNITVIPYIIIALLVVYIISTLVAGTLEAFLFGIFIMFAGAMYPLKVKNITKFIPLFKNFYVAGVHGILILYPFLFIGHPIDAFSGPLVLIFIYVLFEAMVSQIILDTKDTASDKKNKLKTLAVLIGNRKTFVVSIVLTLVSLFYAIAIRGEFNSSPVFASIYFVSLIINAIHVYYAYKHKKIGYLLAASKFSIWIGILLMLPF